MFQLFLVPTLMITSVVAVRFIEGLPKPRV